VLLGWEYWPQRECCSEVNSDLSDIARRMNQLTNQQSRVLRHPQVGRLKKQVADNLEISEATVTAHVTAIFRKHNVPSRTQSIILANHFGLIRRSLSDARINFSPCSISALERHIRSYPVAHL